MTEHKGFGLSNKLIACAASNEPIEPAFDQYPISVFFLPIEGATEFKYFETTDTNSDSGDYSKYIEKSLSSEPVFNGYLRSFKNNTPKQDVWGIVTYKVGSVIHICNPIQLKHYTKPTEYSPQLVTITNNKTFPRFDWLDGKVAENAIYFQVVSDKQNNLISGTYTYEKFFKFYDLSNVVLNIRDVKPIPVLEPKMTYNFLLMSVSIDNWVNQIVMKSFSTE